MKSVGGTHFQQKIRGKATVHQRMSPPSGSITANLYSYTKIINRLDKNVEYNCLFLFVNHNDSFMAPILFRTSFGFIYTFSAIWWGGIILFAGYIWWATPVGVRTFDKLLFPTLFGLLLGRVQFLFLNREYFVENQSERWALFSGGIGYWGLFLGLWLGLLLWFLSVRERPDPQTYRIGQFGLLWLHLIGWTACYFDGCGYGRPGPIDWYTADLPNSFGLYEVRFQTQLAGIIGIILLSLLLWTIYRTVGQQFSRRTDFFITLSALLALQTGLTFTLGVDLPDLYGIRYDTMMGVLSILLILAVWIFLGSGGEAAEKKEREKERDEYGPA